MDIRRLPSKNPGAILCVLAMKIRRKEHQGAKTNGWQPRTRLVKRHIYWSKVVRPVARILIDVVAVVLASQVCPLPGGNDRIC